jgi:hypothetical protein
MRQLSVCTLALCLGFASITHASSVTKLTVKGNTVGGGLSTVEDTCFNGFFNVQASDSVTKDGTSTTATKELMFYFFGSDSCQSLSYSSFVSIPLTVAIANKSTVTFPFNFLVDVTPFDGDVPTAQKRLVGSVTITATGDFQKSRQTDITQNETTRQVVRTKGTTRDASIKVTAKLDNAALNFVTDGGSADIGTTKNGTIEIIRY